jgi:septal ring factor EnvC (AmiA/AmiB activator)
MSIALAQTVRQLEKDVLDLSRTLTDTQALIKELSARIERMEQARKPGPKPKDAHG